MNFARQSERRGGIARRVFVLLALGLVAGLVSAFLWATATPGSIWEGEPGTPDEPELASRLRAHVVVLSSSPRSLQNIRSINLTETYIESELRGLEYQIVRQEVVPPADNIVVKIAAASADAPVLILGAHYDTVSASPGADDNASGVAALLELARDLRALDGKSSIGFEIVFYANEEPPYFHTSAMGSYVHAHSIANPSSIMGMISLETMGYYSDQKGSQNYPFPLSVRYPDTGNFIAFVGDTSSRAFLREMIGEFRLHLKMPSIGGTAPSFVQGIHWSDHWAYSERGIPAFMVTDTAPFRNPHYHRKTDTPETLDYVRLALVTEALSDLCHAKALAK